MKGKHTGKGELMRSLRGLLLLIVVLFPQCYKKNAFLYHEIPVLNDTNNTIKVNFSYLSKKTSLSLIPNETKTIILPQVNIYITARYHTATGYRPTGIEDQERRIGENKKIVILGDEPKYYIARVKKLSWHP